MELSTVERIKIIANRKKIEMGTIAEKTSQTRQNLSNKLKYADFRESDLKQIANALDCDLKITFIDRQTKEEF